MSSLDLTNARRFPSGEGAGYRASSTILRGVPPRTPTRQMVLEGYGIYECLDRGIGAYVIVYDGGAPSEIFFAGYSFD